MTPLLEDLQYSPSCFSCAHWDSKDDAIGLCRLNAPVFSVGYDYGQWPVTVDSGWCSQHQRRL